MRPQSKWRPSRSCGRPSIATFALHTACRLCASLPVEKHCGTALQTLVLLLPPLDLELLGAPASSPPTAAAATRQAGVAVGAARIRSLCLLMMAQVQDQHSRRGAVRVAASIVLVGMRHSTHGRMNPMVTVEATLLPPRTTPHLLAVSLMIQRAALWSCRLCRRKHRSRHRHLRSWRPHPETVSQTLHQCSSSAHRGRPRLPKRQDR